MGRKKTWLKNVSDDWLRENFFNIRQFEIFRYRQMSESFVREFADFIDWNAIGEEQNFGKDFCREW